MDSLIWCHIYEGTVPYITSDKEHIFLGVERSLVFVLVNLYYAVWLSNMIHVSDVVVSIAEKT